MEKKQFIKGNVCFFETSPYFYLLMSEIQF